jgi:RNA polymerase sigma factor (sigma-70 family)
LFDNDNDLIYGCLRKEVAAENHLYHRFAPKMFGICRRYGGNEMEAEEILQTGFMSIFSHLHQFRFEGSFDGWIRRIFVNTGINHCKKNLKFSHDVELTAMENDAAQMEDALSKMSTKELLSMIQGLAPGHRAIFNMYVIENFHHKEIAEILGIAVGTSKSQLHWAKASMRRMLNDREKEHNIG